MVQLQLASLPSGDPPIHQFQLTTADDVNEQIRQLNVELNCLHSRLFEIQEHRHTSSISTIDDIAASTKINHLVNTFDQSLSLFSSHLTSAAAAFSSFLTQSTTTPTPFSVNRELQSQLNDVEKDYLDVLCSDDILKSELAEDKLLNVFKCSADQADEMMDSLQKAISQCLAAGDEMGSIISLAQVNAFEQILKSYEDKKKFYKPSIGKSLMILQKGIKERTTKNGEAIRRHAEVNERFNHLKGTMLELDRKIPALRRNAQEARTRWSDTPETLMDEFRDGSVFLEESSKGHQSRKTSGLGTPLERSNLGLSHTHTGLASPIRQLGRLPLGAQVPSPRPSSRDSKPVRSDASASPYSSSFTRSRSETVTSTTLSSSGMGFGSPRSENLGPSEGYFATLKNKFRLGGPSNQRNDIAAVGAVTIGVNDNSPTAEKAMAPIPRGSPGLTVAQRERAEGLAPETGAASNEPKSLKELIEQEKKMETSGYQLSVPPPMGLGTRPSSPTLTNTSGSTSVIKKKRSMIPVRTQSTTASPSSARSYSLNRDNFGTPPPLSPMPSKEEIHKKEERLAAYLRSTMQTPEPLLRERALRMPFYSTRPAGPTVTPGRNRTASYNGQDSPTFVSPTTNKNPSRFSTGRVRTPASSVGVAAPPSSFRSPTPSSFRSPGSSRPGSSAGVRPKSSATNLRASASSRMGAETPSPYIRGGPGAFIPNKLDELDMELARLLDTIPNDIKIEKLGAPLQKGHFHVGNWEARYAMTAGRTGRREHMCRLVLLDKPGTAEDGKTRKIMIRVGGVWKDLRLYMLELA